MPIRRRKFCQKIASAATLAAFEPVTRIVCSSPETKCPSVTVDDSDLVRKVVGFLHKQMDQFHKSFVIYDDRDSGAIHFYPSGFMGDFETLPVGVASTIVQDNVNERPAVGTTHTRITYPAEVAAKGDRRWAGVYWQFPDGNWGKSPGYDLSRYGLADEVVTLELLVRHVEGDSLGEFKAGGIKNSQLPYKDSFGPIVAPSISDVIDRPGWKRVRWDLSRENLNSVLGAFCWVTNCVENPNGCVIDIDHAVLRFGPAGTKLRLSEPRFVRSYVPCLSRGPDRYFRNAAFLYDQSLLLLAFLMPGITEQHERARILADAMVAAQDHDRKFKDGRLRNVYSCGDLLQAPVARSLDEPPLSARLPGWWDDKNKKWIEDAYALGSDTGNLAWAMIALMHFWKTCDYNSESRYLRAARRLGKWIYINCYSQPGFTGGIAVDATTQEPSPVRWKSVEHNLDLTVCFALLHGASTKFPSRNQEPDYRALSEHARRFCDSMWNAKEGHFWTGTQVDGSINKKPIPLDAQTWGVLALRDRKYLRALAWADASCRMAVPGSDHACGYDFDESVDGIWYEGTAQMVVALALAAAAGKKGGLEKRLEESRQALRIAPSEKTMWGIPASNKDGLNTGFQKEWGQWQYFRRPHIGASVWTLFASHSPSPWNCYWNEPVEITAQAMK